MYIYIYNCNIYIVNSCLHRLELTDKTYLRYQVSEKSNYIYIYIYIYIYMSSLPIYTHR